jgi:hypothetical protein
MDADNAVFAASNQAEAEPSDMSCTTDGDCAVANNSSICWNGCGVVLNHGRRVPTQSATAVRAAPSVVREGHVQRFS